MVPKINTSLKLKKMLNICEFIFRKRKLVIIGEDNCKDIKNRDTI